MNSKVLEVVLVKSLIGSKKFQKSSVNGLGLKKIGQKVTINDTPENRGMIDKAKHLLEVNEEK
ncbi:MAG: 50S ribosomal protein L30 [Gammaproteobacteria bacterium]|jgi:large subunit ribosomal protein L30|nr:MAG: 50S ribosomal protein L30 [Gammaproteobacteria bacterium]